VSERREHRHGWARHEIAAHSATVVTLADARDAAPVDSVEAIFLSHCINHCIETWLSEYLGRGVRITEWDDDGVTLEDV
jgi:hypothetical protein